MGNDVGVVGSGPSARALSAHLAERGRRVHLLTRDATHLAWLRGHDGCVRATGKIDGTFQLAGGGDDPAAFARACETIYLATVVTAYPDVVARLAPHLRAGQRIVCFSSKLGGSVEVAHLLALAGVRGVEVVETDALFACRIQDDGSVRVRGIKQWTLYAGPTRRATEAARAFFEREHPGLEAADHVIQRGLTDFGAVAHAPTVIANMNRIDRGESFLFYLEGWTERTIVIMQTVEAELNAIAHAFDTTLVPMAEVLDRYYGGGHEGTLLSAMHAVPNYRESLAPTTLDHRYVREDVSSTLVLASQLAALAGVATPTIDAVIQLASLLHGSDYRSEGRSLARLGWSGLSAREILERVRG